MTTIARLEVLLPETMMLYHNNILLLSVQSSVFVGFQVVRQ
jgi:hypothetical protein